MDKFVEMYKLLRLESLFHEDIENINKLSVMIESAIKKKNKKPPMKQV